MKKSSLKDKILIPGVDTKMENVHNHAVDISFCLPVYNVRPFIGDCISSIIAACDESITYEILCVDDGSSDGTKEILKDYASNEPAVRVLANEENRGVSYTRNRLMKEAVGQYIWFVDPDDLLIPDIAKDFLQEARKLNCDILLGNYIRVPENTQLNQKHEGKAEEECPKKTEDFLPMDANGKVMCAIWAGLFRRDFLIKNALFMNEKMIAQEDTLFYYEFSLRTTEIYKWEKNCYLYRQRSSSVMNSHSDVRAQKYYRSMREMLRVYQEHLEQNDYNDKESLLRKIHHSKQNVASCLASLQDRKFIRAELKKLKKEKVYPFKLRQETLQGGGPFVQRLLTFLLPIEPLFWAYHFVYIVRDKTRK